ncbi:hypothetical protein ACLB2K_073047 [Fragaria x ananassa]
MKKPKHDEQSRPWGGQGGAVAQGPRPAKGPFFYCPAYVFLLDKSDRIRWQGSGVPAPEEASSLLPCTSTTLRTFFAA